MEAQRVYYHQAGFPPAPGRHLFLANRQRTRFANGFSARLQQGPDETDEQPDNQSGGGGGGGGSNTAGGIGAVTGGGGSTSGGDSESPGDNGIDDTQNDIDQPTKTPSSRAGGLFSVCVLNENETHS